MKLRTSRALVFSACEGDILICNFLTKDVVQSSPGLVEILTAWHDWCSPSDLEGLLPADRAALVRNLVPDLVARHILVPRGSLLADREDEFERRWHWGLPAAVMHFCVQDEEYLSLAESAAVQVEQAVATVSPELFLRNPRAMPIIKLPDHLSNDPLMELMARRRTVRAAGAPAIALDELSACLFAGLGITGWTTGTTGRLPLAMTPSGGARNPYEAYVLAVNVEGLEPGLYHYSAVDHDLGKLDRTDLPKLSELVGGQEWADEMPALILLCADFERSMWKYRDANAYRVMLIEAGHIGQNIMLAATRHSLTACPTAALSHSRISGLLDLDPVTSAPIYALLLAVPGKEANRPDVSLPLPNLQPDESVAT